jgi:UDP-GlcNAc:undecaprenyl-phosphate GlcNAc-1-phosphate transferase
MVAGADVSAIDLGQPFFGEFVELGWLSTPFSIVIVLTAINAFNMFDGSDGVAGIQALIALVFLGLACMVGGSLSCLPFVLGLMGCIVGFLIFNWPLKRTHNVRAFMGDAGSTMLGFSLAWLSLDLSQGPARVISPVVALWVFALPLYDLFSSMVRRVSQGSSPFHGDSEHLHHLLRRFGLSSRQVAQVVLLASSAMAAIGVGAYLNGISDGWLFTSWIVLGVSYHIIFGSGLVIARREGPRDDEATMTGRYWTIWKQR